MAKQRVINTHFWNDDFILDLEPNEKLLFLYILTNPQTDLCGAYQIALKRIAFDTGLEPTIVYQALSKFEAAGKIFYQDGWMIVRNFARHQVNNPKVQKGIERSLSACPDWVKDRLSIDYDSLRILQPKLQPKPEPIGEEAATPPAPPKDFDKVIHEPERFDHPAVVLFEEFFGFKAGSGFASSVATRVSDLTVWKLLLENKRSFADHPRIEERKKVCGWILDAYDERIKEKQNGTTKQSYQDRRAELAKQSYDRASEIRRRVERRDRELSGKALPDHRRQFQLVESNANGQRESGESGSVGEGVDGDSAGVRAAKVI